MSSDKRVQGVNKASLQLLSFFPFLMNMEGFGLGQIERKGAGGVGGGESEVHEERSRRGRGGKEDDSASCRSNAQAPWNRRGRLLLNDQKTTLGASAGLDKTPWTRTGCRAAITTQSLCVMGMNVSGVVSS